MPTPSHPSSPLLAAVAPSPATALAFAAAALVGSASLNTAQAQSSLTPGNPYAPDAPVQPFGQPHLGATMGDHHPDCPGPGGCMGMEDHGEQGHLALTLLPEGGARIAGEPNSGNSFRGSVSGFNTNPEAGDLGGLFGSNGGSNPGDEPALGSPFDPPGKPWHYTPPANLLIVNVPMPQGASLGLIALASLGVTLRRRRA